MSRRRKNLRAFLHNNPYPTIEGAWCAAWEQSQKMYHARKIQELEAEVKHLKHSLGLCHYYAGCDEFVCELDGDMCTGQRVRPIESDGK